LISVAPMMDWTDRHCRYFHRLITQHTRLYTEMITTGALLHGDVPRHLRFNAQEHPLALQLGGSEPADLAACAKLAQSWGYDEINLNCGCPSERVQRGAFGACLMNEAALVADCVKAMRDACDLPITVKHRIGIGREESLTFVHDFIGKVADAGCEVFIVHARNAWLTSPPVIASALSDPPGGVSPFWGGPAIGFRGLSPKENREIPPLRYAVVHALKNAFPKLTIVLNGGLKTSADIAEQLTHVDGVMVGREAYHNPWCMVDWDSQFGPGVATSVDPTTREEVEAQMVAYMGGMAQQGEPWSRAARHMLGLYNSQPGARRWRQVWSDHRLKSFSPQEVMFMARQALAQQAL
jgi:tRNA-dihydrouridine synthase A